MNAGLPAYAIQLAERARTGGHVAVYAGAGVSIAQPTGLPSGGELAAGIYAKLRTAFKCLDEIDPTDLVAVADAVAAEAGGAEALRQVAAGVADFTSARPSYGHRVMALLVLEGMIDVVTTNWDDCIERGGMPERLNAITDGASLVAVTPPSILKVHGCASRPSSLLVTSADLRSPPRWAREQTHARLGSAIVVFLGIGDVAGYVRQRIEEAIHDVGNIANLRVVSPDISNRWEESQWAQVAPNLVVEHRIQATSDQFMEDLGAAYVQLTLNTHIADLATGDPDVAEALRAAVDALLLADPMRVLSWARQADVSPSPGTPVLGATVTAEALAALGHIAASNLIFSVSGAFETESGPIEILVATRTMAYRRVEQEAENRLFEHASRGEPLPRFLVAGGIGWPAMKGSGLPQDVLSEDDVADIIAGPRAHSPEIMLAQEVLAS